MPDTLLDVPETCLFDALRHGALVSLCRAYWYAGCTGLPQTADGIQTLSRCTTKAWSRVQGDVMRAFHAVQPNLKEEWTQQSQTRAKLQAKAAHMRRTTEKRFATTPRPELADRNLQSAPLNSRHKPQETQAYTAKNEPIPRRALRGIDANLSDSLSHKT